MCGGGSQRVPDPLQRRPPRGGAQGANRQARGTETYAQTILWSASTTPCTHTCLHVHTCTCTCACTHACACKFTYAYHVHAHAHTQVVDPRFSVILTLIADRRLIRSKAFSPPAHPRGCAKARTESRQVNARESHACTRIASLESGVCANLASSA